MFNLGNSFDFHRIMRTCAVATSKCSDAQIIGTIVSTAFDVANNAAPSPSSAPALISGLGAVVARIHEDGAAKHPTFLALADMLTQQVDEPSFIAAIFSLAPHKMPSSSVPFSKDSVHMIAKHVVANATSITAKAPTDQAEISRLVCAIESGPQ